MHKFATLLLALLLASLAPIAAAAPGAPEPKSPTQTSTTLMSEGFEGTWPSTGWSLRSVDGVDPRYWGKATYQKHAGTYSVWPAAGGPGAITPAQGVVYPDNLSSEMVYGPFNLSAAKSAEIHFWLWTDIEAGYDTLYFDSSANGTNYVNEGQWDSQLDWSEVVVDLSKYAGDSSVWVRWYFVSDYSTGLGGPYIDDVSILMDTGLDTPAVKIKRSGASDIRLDWPADPDATAFEVWRGTNSPYFTPGTTCTAPACTSVTTNYFVDTGASGNTTNNYSYVVRGVKGTYKSADSNRTGEFDFSLTKGN